MLQPLHMKPFTELRGFDQPPKLAPPRSKTITSSEAVSMITAEVEELQPNLSEQNQSKLKFWTKKLVSDILDYCNRRDDDFPLALIYTVANLLDGYIQRAQVDEETGGSLPLKRIKQDDVEFEFAVDNVDLNAWLSGIDISPIKAQLNLYRWIRSW